MSLSSSLLVASAILVGSCLLALVWGAKAPSSSHRSAWVATSGTLAIALLAAVAEPGRDFSWTWVERLGLQFDFRLDGFAQLLLVIIGVIGTLVLAFTAVYLRAKPAAGRFVAAMVAFAAAMSGLVLSADVITLFVFWEATTFTSYLLIGHYHQTSSARRAARQAALITGLGGLVMLVGLVLVALEAGTTSIAGIVEQAPAHNAGWALVLVGAMTKSAQFPFHWWLPSAMAAPTPASAFLHSATMVKAGIILAGRLGPGATSTEWWTPVVLSIGLVTMAWGAVQALRQYDLKLILAYGTVSALGLMFGLIGSAEPALVAAGVAVLVAHAMYKAALFLFVGAIDKEEKTRDIRKLTGLLARRPLLFAGAALAAASMAGVPMLFGFAAKESVLESVLGWSDPLAVGIAALSALTAAYTVRFLLGAFGGVSPGVRARSAPGLLAPGLFLGFSGLVFGVIPDALTSSVTTAAASLVGSVDPPKLVVWPGFVPALALSTAGLLVGGWLGARSLRVVGDGPGLRSHVFDTTVDRVQRGAEQLTAVIQNGSLPVYLGQIMTVAIVVPLPALVRFGVLPAPSPGGLVEWIVVAFVIAASLAALNVKRRMSAVLLLGAVGYGMSALFALAGAPDVAITQVLVETLVVALFALALRLLPVEFSARIRFSPWKGLVAVAIGVFAMAVTLIAGAGGGGLATSQQLIDLSVPEANGANVVNVTLVDFRALDTLGEIAVLGIAALGVIALVRPLGDLVDSRRVELPSSPILDRGQRIIGPLLLVFATYLLFAGHNQPGGGFAAGLVASGWIVIAWLSSGARGLKRSLKVEPQIIIGIGLAVAVVVGFGGLVWSDSFLASQAWTIDAGLIGQVKVVTPLFFDAGVALTVLGSVAAAIKGLEAA